MPPSSSAAPRHPSPSPPSLKYGFPPPYLLPRIKPDDLKNRHLMLLCAILARVGNQALCPKEMESVCRHFAFDGPNGCESAFQAAIRLHINRFDTSQDPKDKALISAIVLTGESADLRLRPSIGAAEYFRSQDPADTTYQPHNYYAKKNGLARKGAHLYFLSPWTGFPNPFESKGLNDVESEMAKGQGSTNSNSSDDDSSYSDFEEVAPPRQPLKLHLSVPPSAPAFTFNTLPTSISAFSPSGPHPHTVPELIQPPAPPSTPPPSSHPFLSPSTPSPFLLSYALRGQRSDSLISSSTSPSPPLSPSPSYDSPFSFHSPSPKPGEKPLLLDFDIDRADSLFSTDSYSSPIHDPALNFNFMKLPWEDQPPSPASHSSLPLPPPLDPFPPVSLPSLPTKAPAAVEEEPPVPTDDDLERCRWFNWDPFPEEKEELPAEKKEEKIVDVENFTLSVKRKRSLSSSEQTRKRFEEDREVQVGENTRPEEDTAGKMVGIRIPTLKLTSPLIYATIIDDIPVFCTTHPATSKTLIRLINTSFINLSSLMAPSPIPLSLPASASAVTVKSEKEEIEGVWVPLDVAKELKGVEMEVFLSDKLEELFDKAALAALGVGLGEKMFGSGEANAGITASPPLVQLGPIPTTSHTSQHKRRSSRHIQQSSIPPPSPTQRQTRSGRVVRPLSNA